MSKPLLDQQVLDLVRQNQPITAATVAKLLPENKVSDITIVIYQILQPKGFVVQSGHEGTKPMWWTPDGLFKHQKKQQALSMDAEWREQAETPTILEEKRQRDDLRRRILDLLATQNQSLQTFQKNGLEIEEIAAILEELEENKLIKRESGVYQQDCKTNGIVCPVWSLVKKPESKSLKTRYIEQLADRILGLLRHGGVQTIEEMGTNLEDFDHDDITMALEELKSRKLVANWGDDAWIIAAPPTEQSDAEDIAAAQRYVATTETKDDGSVEIDRKTLQKGVKDAIDKMEVNQKRWAACMRTSNPTLASRLLELLASKPQDTANLAEELDTFQRPTYDLCMELCQLGQIERTLGSWQIFDKSARIEKIRQDFHRLVDNLCDLVTML